MKKKILKKILFVNFINTYNFFIYLLYPTFVQSCMFLKKKLQNVIYKIIPFMLNFIKIYKIFNYVLQHYLKYIHNSMQNTEGLVLILCLNINSMHI